MVNHFGCTFGPVAALHLGDITGRKVETYSGAKTHYLLTRVSALTWWDPGGLDMRSLGLLIRHFSPGLRLSRGVDYFKQTNRLKEIKLVPFSEEPLLNGGGFSPTVLL
jgi:hypothetical protein